MASTGYWALAPRLREQFVLFPTRMDEVIAADAPVRLLGERLDFSAMEARYDGHRSQPAIHPPVLTGALLYGMMMHVRSSRRTEWR